MTPIHFQTLMLTLGISVVGSNSMVLSPILTDVAATFSVSPSVVGRAFAAYGATTAIFALLAGKFIDQLGAKRILITGMLFLLVGTAASSVTYSWVTLCLAQAIAGIGGGMVLPASYQHATSIGDEFQGAKTLGRVIAGWSIAMVVGVPISAFIADLTNWRYVYIILSMLSVFSLLGYFQFEKNIKKQVFKSNLRQAFKVPDVPALLFISFSFMVAFYGTYPYIGDFVRTTLQISATQAGFIVFFYGLGFGLASIADGLVDYYGPKRLYTKILGCIAFVYLIMSSATVNYALVCAFAFIWGQFNHFGLNITVLLLSKADRKQSGAILGINSAVTYLAVMVGALFFGMIYEIYSFWSISFTAFMIMLIAVCVSFKWVSKA